MRVRQSRTALRGAAEQVPGCRPSRVLSPVPFVEGTAGSCRGHSLILESSCQATGAPEVPLLSLEAGPPGSSWGACEGPGQVGVGGSVSPGRQLSAWRCSEIVISRHGNVVCGGVGGEAAPVSEGVGGQAQRPLSGAPPFPTLPRIRLLPPRAPG